MFESMNFGGFKNWNALFIAVGEKMFESKLDKDRITTTFYLVKNARLTSKTDRKRKFSIKYTEVRQYS